MSVSEAAANEGTMRRILRLMAERNASDVYLSAQSPALIRIEGECIPINNQLLPPDAPLNLLREILSPSQIEELIDLHELNIGWSMPGVGRFRISGMRQRGSFAVVIRLINYNVPPLNSLGVPDCLGDLILQKRGLILVVGATGAGKSTTMAAMIDHRNAHRSGHILTIEDPIEFLFKNKRSVINQREVGTDTQSMQLALKNALRQAPDVIMIGEIRDRETMSAAIAYAQTGHLCLATLHANNSYQALNRILSFYPVETRPTLLGDLAATLKAIVSQRLLRTVRGQRTPAVEVMMNTKLVSDMIEKGKFGDIVQAMENSLAEGSQTYEQDIARLVIEGIVERSEGMLHADSPTNLMWRLDNAQQQRASGGAPGTRIDPPDSEQALFTEITLDTDE
ncbi:MAG: PilT/PilU family type 4a pilus ATPase [Rhodoferax sp.]